MIHTFQGTVQWYNSKRGRGRIRCDRRSDGDVLMHRRACDFEPRIGDRVHFRVTADAEGKLRAVDIERIT
jgi:cold shock CspA family protein